MGYTINLRKEVKKTPDTNNPEEGPGKPESEGSGGGTN